MSLARKIIIYGVLVLIAAGLLIGSFYYYTRIKATSIDPITAIPDNTTLIFEFHDPLKTIDHLQQDNKIWNALKGIRQFRSFANQVVLFDSLVNQDPDLQELLSGKSMYISLHHDMDLQPGFLIIVGLDPSLSAYTIHDFISAICTSRCQTREISYGDTDIECLFKDSTSVFSYVIHKGLFIGSVNENLVKKSIDQLRSGESLSSDSFVKLQRTAGKKVDANIYARFGSMDGLLLNASSPSYHASISPLTKLGQWMETDLIIKEDELLLNGYTDAIDSTAQFLNIFANQEAQKIEFPRILPYNTNFILSLGFESFDRFIENYRQHLVLTGQIEWHEEVLTSLNSEFNTDFLKSTSRWIGNEVALVATGYGGAEQLIYSIIHIRDKDLASEYLNMYSAGVPIDYKNFKIKRVSGDHSIPSIFGKAFQGDSQPFFIQIDDYFIFAENPASLEQFINIYLSGKTLKRNENYQNFADNLSDKSNIFIYLNVRNSSTFISKYLSPPLVDLIESNRKVFSNFEGLAAQFTLSNNMYYTSIYAKYNPSYVQEDLSIWKTILDSEIQKQPYFVKDHRTGTLKIIVFDRENQMYMIDHNGKILWKIPIGETVLSNVFPVDYYKNGKIQYLFNTANHIYLIDLLGRPVEGYPIKLSPNATNGIAVFDYEGNKNYRLLLAKEDNRIYNYDIKGLPIRGWNKPMARETIKRPIEHVRMRNKDYLVVSDIDGNVMILNRRGKHRINLKEEYIQADHSSFYPNRTNSAKGIMLTTDQKGKLTYIQSNGHLTKTDFGEFTPGHYFLYEDFDNNGHKDFIYLDKNELVVYDRFKQTIMQHTFKNEISSSPVIIPVSQYRNIIGIVSGVSRKVYLFDDEGTLISTPDMVGNTQILVGSLLNDGQLNLIVGSGRTLYNYYFQ